MWTLVRQWRQKRVLMRPEAAFPYVSAAEGAQHPPKKPPRSTFRHAQRSATLNVPPRSTFRHAQRPATLNALPRSSSCRHEKDRRDSANHKKRMTSTDVILL